MPIVCSVCGFENPAEARFCNQCGSQLQPASVREGERRQISVFFSDLSGYTRLSERFDPEDVQAVMDRVFGHATEIVESYGGRIDKFLGDAVMGVFGDPVSHEDDAERAVRAVLDLHAAVDELSLELEDTLGSRIALHSGINSGVVVTGADFDSAVGDAINVAARLEDLSEPGQILIGPETARLVAGIFDTDDYGEHELKGKSRRMPVTLVRGLAPTRTEPSRLQGSFVGRDEELGVLLGTVERMLEGESSVTTIQAEAGAGKTRLLSEFRMRLPDDVQWLEGRAYSYGQNIPYAAVIDLMSEAMGIAEDDDPAIMEAKLQDAVSGLVEDADRHLAPLSRLFGLTTPDGVTLDRETYRERLLDAVVAMVESLARRRPTVLAFQDLHWADPSTVRLIREAIERVEAPVSVVANYRPGFSLNAGGERELILKELSPHQTSELLASLLDGRPVPDELTNFIVQRTDGNPFFVEEIVNSLIETGAVGFDGNSWQLSTDFDLINLPTSIRGVIGARIDRFDDLRRRVLREAAVVGREFLYDVVKRVTTVTDELDPSLHDLEVADLIREKSPDPDLEYFFKHALTQEVAYEGLLKSEREQLHARAASAIEAQFAGRLEEVTETLAYHYSHSGITEKALYYLMAAGRKAIERFALAESQAHYRAAYELLESEPPSAAKDVALVDVLLEWAFLAYYQARLADLLELLTKHQNAVDRVADPERLGMWTGWIGHCQYMAEGQFRKGVATLDRALKLGQEASSPRVIAYAQAWRVWGLWWLGNPEEALKAGAEAEEMSRQLVSEPYPWIKSQCGVAFVLARDGEFEKARAIADDLIGFGERTGNARSRAMGYFVQTQIAQTVVDDTAARLAYQAAVDAANDPIYQHSPAISLFYALIKAGAMAEARALHDDQIERFIEGRHVRFSRRLFQLGEGVLLAVEGSPNEGFDQIEEVMDRSTNDGELLHVRAGEVMLASMYGHVAQAESPTLREILKNAPFSLRRGLRAKKEARTRLERLLSRLDEWGENGTRFQIEYELAQLLAHEGSRGEAAAHLRAAIEAVKPAGDTQALHQAQDLLAELTGDS
ncbi:MAG: AAA family ATPase [Acidimicrobiia bacterium]